MKLSKFDIGGEVISILTKGMYPDPRDAVREYIQNGIDAKCKNIDVKVRQSSVVIQDDGSGMDYATLRKALRVGISDKKPGKDVGFMGIGIYSAFHLCDSLTIYSRQSDKLPLRLEMDFVGMRNTLNKEREKRANSQIKSEELTDLQTLLEQNINLSPEGELQISEFPVDKGTRVELQGLDPILDDLLSKFDDLAKYLRDVVPLHFDENKFKWAKLVETKLAESAAKHLASFDLVNLKLQVSGKSENLYRPYLDSEFTNASPQEPIFKDIRDTNGFYGVAWGCLNSTRNRIQNDDIRGFILKKQGFSIGTRRQLAKYFGKSNTHFDRYTGEIIILNSKILPNASRNDLEFSSLRTAFYNLLSISVAVYFNGISTKFQENSLALKQIRENAGKLKSYLARFTPFEDNPDVLITMSADAKRLTSEIEAKIKKRKVHPDNIAEAERVVAAGKELEAAVRDRLTFLITEKTKSTSPSKANKNRVQAADKLADYSAKDIVRYETFLEMLEDIDFPLNDVFSKLCELIDERFIQAIATNKEEYYQQLSDLKAEIDNLEILH